MLIRAPLLFIIAFAIEVQSFEGDFSHLETLSSDPCSDKPFVTGPCRAFFIRFSWDGKTCSDFVYGGCERTRNNFESKEDCLLTCAGNEHDDVWKVRLIFHTYRLPVYCMVLFKRVIVQTGPNVNSISKLTYS